jgi:hypothetical protein
MQSLKEIRFYIAMVFWSALLLFFLIALKSTQTKNIKMENSIQIDVKKIDTTNDQVSCNMYTPQSCVTITISYNEYTLLKQEGFFIRQKDQPDSAGMLNTSHVYVKKQIK